MCLSQSGVRWSALNTIAPTPEIDQQLQDGTEMTWNTREQHMMSHTGSQYVNECLLTTRCGYLLHLNTPLTDATLKCIIIWRWNHPNIKVLIKLTDTILFYFLKSISLLADFLCETINKGKRSFILVGGGFNDTTAMDPHFVLMINLICCQCSQLLQNGVRFVSRHWHCACVKCKSTLLI